MPLPTNPDFQYVGTSWATVDAISQANGGGNIPYGSTTQFELDQKIANLSGGPGSNINYIANGAPNQNNNSTGEPHIIFFLNIWSTLLNYAIALLRMTRCDVMWCVVMSFLKLGLASRTFLRTLYFSIIL
jgi:hypothetical protein